VEILSTVEERMPGLPQITPDMIGSLKTLGQIVAFLEGGQTAVAEKEDQPDETLPSTEPARPTESCLVRQVIQPTLLPPLVKKADATSQGTLWVAGVEEVFKAALCQALQSYGFDTLNIDGVPTEETRSPAGVILISDLAPADALTITQAAAPHLRLGSDGHPGLLVSVSRLDGAFGFFGQGISAAEQGGLAGLIKTAAIEWPDVVCQAIDVAPAWDDTTAAGAVADEIAQLDAHSPREVGLSQSGRCALALLPAPAPPGDLGLSEGDLVLVSGGARGVTAAAATALAQAAPVELILLGRTPAPEEEPAWLAGLEDPAQIKRALMTHGFDAVPTPKALEKRFRRLQAQREIQATLDQLTALGARASYHEVDIRNAGAVKALVDRFRRDRGMVRGLVHGAGVLEDRLIIDKTPEQFDRVYLTKTAGLDALLAATAEDDLRQIVLFSSVSGRMGNSGQVDYAVANEVLNKKAQQLAVERPHCRVTAINWGPWDGGMVTPELKKAFRERGADLIPIQAGAAALVAEMQAPAGSEAEVVITCQAAGTGTGSEMKVLHRQELDLIRCPVLKDHVVGGKPVVPLALMAEWLGHSVMRQGHYRSLFGLDEVRVLSGIRLDQPSKVIRLLAGTPTEFGTAVQVPVEIRDEYQGGSAKVHARAIGLLTTQRPAPPRLAPPFAAGKDTLVDMDTVYNDILFHGEQLHCLETITHFSPQGAMARLAAAPAPGAWLKEPLHESWCIDPLILDGAFQLAIVWTHRFLGKRGLPSYFASYRQYCDRFPTTGALVSMAVTHTTANRLRADFLFFDGDERVLAHLRGFEATVDKALDAAFRARHAA
jgi:NAD(P)-dependent dehydrogenase (short-subunit alcohol dehydrogenase family)